MAERGGVTYFLTNPMSVDDHALAMRDGSSVIVHPEPYRAEFVAPTGAPLCNASIGTAPKVAGDAEQREAIARRWFVPGYSGPRWEPHDFEGWPRFLPPFVQNRVLSVPDGTVVIRSTAAQETDGVKYDLVRRRGTVSVARLRLRPNQRIVGFGKNSVYLVTKDPDDLETLSVHQWRTP